VLTASKAPLSRLRHELREAGDDKITRVIAMLDQITDPKVNQALFDPLRARLAVLRPARPLRFSRLLFIPLDPLIVPPLDWNPGDASIPRTALVSMAGVVRTGLGSGAGFVDGTIAGHTTESAQVITVAGEALWPRAAEILASARAPSDWAETGLRSSCFPALAEVIAAVLHRAVALHGLSRNSEVGVVQADDQVIGEILSGIGSVHPEGCAMILRLILLQAPQAVPLVRRFIAAMPDPGEQIKLKKAAVLGTERLLSRMEGVTGFQEEIGRGPLDRVGAELRRITLLLQEIERDPAASRHLPRLEALRKKLDLACRERFSEELNDGLVSSLDRASAPLDGLEQMALEARARELRVLETTARGVGGGASYDRLLLLASESVTAADVLTQIGKCRLVEILCGPEAAEVLYRTPAAAM
jgi:hypothetical protein